MPENTVKVDRATIWGNPYAVGSPGQWWVPRAEPKAGWEVSYHMNGPVCVYAAVIFFSAWLHNKDALAPRPAQLTRLGRATVQHAMDCRRDLILARLPELRGKNLACWCKPGTPCHTDVLLELANK